MRKPTMKKIILGAALCGLLAAGCSLDKSYLNGPNALTFPASKAEVEADLIHKLSRLNV